MLNNKRLLPIVVALSIGFGIIIGNLLDRGQGRVASVQKKSFVNYNKLGNVLHVIDKQYVDTVNTNELIEEMIPKILEDLDPHSVYIPAKNLQSVNDELGGSFGGIGVQFNKQEDTVVVIAVISGGPSEKVGILPGDRIVTVNDSLIAGVKIENDDIVGMLRGERGTKVNVGIKRSGIDGLIDFEITRGIIPMYSVDVSYMLNPTTGYIKIGKFGSKTYDEFIQGVGLLMQEGCKSLIVDLRGNQGGYLHIVAKMANEFLKKGDMIVYTEGKANPRSEYRANGSGSCKSTRVIVLIDEWSASASEIFAGSMQDHDRGVVVGRRSFGKGLVQTQIDLDDGSALRLTISKYYTASGRCIQKSYENGNEDYSYDIWNRFMHGEMENKDSIKVDKMKTYYTTNGRLVYGGGGIMPDVFVPRDTTGLTPFFSKIVQKGLIYKFAFRFTDTQREKLSSYKDVEALVAYLDKSNIWEQFQELLQENNIQYSRNEEKESKQLILVQIKAYIARNILDNKGYYPVIREVDETLERAEKIALMENAAYESMLKPK